MIDNFLAQSQEEHLTLDFKVVNRPDLSHSDDKKNLAKALSGFANSSGGIIIWGVDARKNTDGVDCACGKREIKPLSLFISRLNELTGEGVSPTVSAVRHRSITVAEDSGFAVTIVPESESCPHMAKLGEDRYYKRSGDSFYKMEHYDLEDMFGRRKKPKLNLITKFAFAGGGTNAGSKHVNVQITFALENVGRGPAKAPLLALTIKSKHRLSEYGIDGNWNFGLDKLPHATGSLDHLFGGSSITVIHPGTYREVCAITCNINQYATQAESIVVDYLLASEETKATSGEYVIRGEDIFQFALSQFTKIR
ncbi:MAG: ATP-binding protein [Ignavibacteriales bacterium]|nr:ATP-binding protein [Ignavibacteriales bacterium]